MDAGDEQLTEDEGRMLENGQLAFEILNEWATSGTRLIYSTGLYGLNVEGTIIPLRKPVLV